MAVEGQTDHLPLVTVILPIRNEGEHIRKVIESVLEQDYPPNLLEVIVADGMSSDGTRDIVRSYQKTAPNLRLIDNPGRIVPTALNCAIRVATGSIIVRVDGHTIIEPDYVRTCIEEIRRTGADNVGGRMVAVGNSGFGEAVALATSSPFGIGGAKFHYSTSEEWVDTVYMGAWPREVFDRIGLFDEEMVRSQDSEFNYRLRANGGKILLSPRIKSKYYARSTLKSLVRQYFQYGYWKVRVFQKHPRQMQLRQFVAPAFVSALIVSAALSPVSKWARGTLALTVGSYAVANLAASGLTARRNGWRHLPILPLVFAAIHISWGLGFLSDLVRFAGKWGKR
ncbi:MAG: glycosyltransferase family 2 protein [Chloroflexota bacterium]